MTFSSINKNKEIVALQEDNAHLKKSIDDLTAKLDGTKDQSEAFATFKVEHTATMEAVKVEYQNQIDTITKDFQTKLDAVNLTITALTKEKETLAQEKVAVVEAHKEAITVATEIKDQELNKAVAVKLASIGVPEGSIPAPALIEHDDKESIMSRINTLRKQNKHKEASALYVQNRHLYAQPTTILE